MSERRKIRITVFDAERYDGDWPPEKLADAAAWLQAKLDSVPPEYRDAVNVEFGSASGYEGDHYAQITIDYWRPETDEEVAARDARKRAAAEERRQQEIATLRALQAKYGAVE